MPSTPLPRLYLLRSVTIEGTLVTRSKVAACANVEDDALGCPSSPDHLLKTANNPNEHKSKLQISDAQFVYSLSHAHNQQARQQPIPLGVSIQSDCAVISVPQSKRAAHKLVRQNDADWWARWQLLNPPLQAR